MESIEQAINNFKSRRILVMGDLILDKFSYGVIERLNPEQPASPLLKITHEEYMLGGAGNVARNVSSLGAYVTLFSEIGNDEYAQQLENLCKESGINLKYLKVNRRNLVKQRLMAHGQQIARADYGERELKHFMNQKAMENILWAMEFSYDAIILSDYAKTFFDLDLTQGIIRKARDKGIKVISDFKPQNANMFYGCNYLCPNHLEASKIAGVNAESSLEGVSKKVAKIINPEAVIITCGKDGAYLYDCSKNESYQVPTRAREVADVTGAGDTFTATFALGIASNLSLNESLEMANYAAGIVVEKPGTAIATRKELLEAVRKV